MMATTARTKYTPWIAKAHITQDLNYRAAGNLHWADFNENVQSTHSHLNPTTTVLAIDKSDPIS